MFVDDPVFLPLWKAVHDRLCAGEAPEKIAALRIRGLTAPAIAELRTCLDTTARRRRGRSAVVVDATSVVIPFRELLTALEIATEQVAVLAERATGIPVIDKAALRQGAAALRKDLWAYAAERLPRLPKLTTRMRMAGVSSDEDAIRHLIDSLALVIALLPCRPPVSLPKLAHDATGDPHYFDLNTLNGARLVAAVAELVGVSEPRRPDHVRALLASRGITADRLSATVLLHNVRVVGDGPIDRRLRDAAAPVALTLLDLVEYPPAFSTAAPLTVVENPSVLEAAMVAGATIPLACTSGHFRGVDHALLQLAHDQGIHLRYAGDLDPDGRLAAAQAAELYGAELIAMEGLPSEAIYQEHDAILRRLFSTEDV
ncbi:DUF2399 domain-containing protein [Nonomuraea sp. NN258]|uniref:TIGR02679 domain-containing protein n=1 Tax=Nonomuraea antri TaxID=2730852 RepID=UPI00156A5927|nr:TIGR02679 domain-containing protein [Nonomuraea antri]NRQ32124.1 DUF2399 domain-containing protein [Nonomuraea antri]